MSMLRIGDGKGAQCVNHRVQIVSIHVKASIWKLTYVISIQGNQRQVALGGFLASQPRPNDEFQVC